MLDTNATNRVLQIGAGGVGAALAQNLSLCSRQLAICDGDTFEPKNEVRQPFAIGKTEHNKAEVIAKACGNGACETIAIPEFITPSNFKQLLKEIRPTLIVLCVDNDKARKTAFAHNGEYPILWAANEVWDPQAGLTTPKWRWNPMKFFRPAEGNNEGCGEQTIHANMAAAAMGTQLLHLHLSPEEKKNVKKEVTPIFLARVGELTYQLTPPEVR